MDESEKLRRQLADRCRALRKKAGLSQLDLVRHHDFSLSHYQKIERGDLDPRMSTLKKLADAYGVSLSVLMRHVGT